MQVKFNSNSNSNNPLKAKGLSVMPLTGQYAIVNCKIDRLTISMYRLITDALLHDSNPTELATEVKDFWESEAETLYDNNEINHREFEHALDRICHLIVRCQADLGVIQTD